MSDGRPRMHVAAAVNPDAVRSFYELPDALVHAVKAAVGGGGASDTLSFDQALHALVEDQGGRDG